jgi:putative transcriptional regulator
MTITKNIAEVRSHRPTAQARAKLRAVSHQGDELPSGTKPMPAAARTRLKDGHPKPSDLADFRAMLGMSQPDFAAALGISVGTLRNWEQGRRAPDGPAIALLRLAARHPRLLLESLALAG